MDKSSVGVVSGDITKFKVDALITAINSGGMWFGGIDSVIQRTSGDYFHKQAAAAMPLKDGQTVVARCSPSFGNSNGFRHVVFVVDDLRRSLAEVVYDGLKGASDAGFKSVSLPTIRMGVMLGAVEKTLEEAVVGISTGVRSFLKKNPDTSLESITFVVYNDKKIQSLLQSALD